MLFKYYDLFYLFAFVMFKKLWSSNNIIKNSATPYKKKFVFDAVSFQFGVNETKIVTNYTWI